jgi:menaquinone-dependent protoporphyrinogen IX oxidase
MADTERRIIIGFSSWFGNGRTAAATLARECEERGAAVIGIDLLADGVPPEAAATEWDVAVIVAPVRAGIIARPARKFARAVSRQRGAVVAIVITHAAPLDHFFSPAKSTGRLVKRLRRRKATLLTDPVYLQVQTQEGPLPVDYAERMAELATTITT